MHFDYEFFFFKRILNGKVIPSKRTRTNGYHKQRMGSCPFCLAFSSFPGYTFSMRDFTLFCLI